MEDLQKNVKIRYFATVILPAIISAMGIVVTISDNVAFKTTIILVEVALLLVTWWFLWMFSKQDSVEQKKKEETQRENEHLRLIVDHLERQCSSYVKTNGTLAALTSMWANRINIFANNVKNNSSVHESDWDKKSIYNVLCEKCRDFIQDYVGVVDPSKVSVGFIEYIAESEKIVFVAHSNSESSRPEKYECEENISESKYYYAKLIQDKATDIEVACSNEEVRHYFRDVNPGSSLAKYTQYIAIPVYCSKRKMLGVLQVVTKHDYVIEKTDVELKKFAECNLILFANLFVLVDKIQKGLYVRPGEKKKHEEEK